VKQTPEELQQLVATVLVVVAIRSTWVDMSVFDFLLAALGLAPLALLLFFWMMFPRDRGIHPIYRENAIDTIDKKPEPRT